jgi:hypothetical protein
MGKLSIFIAACLLAACSREKPMDRATGAPPVAAEAAATDGAATPATAPLVFRVMREGGGGLDATINRIDPQGQASFYVTVPGSGEAALEKACGAGQRFQAEPKVAAFLRGPTQDCAARVEFMLYSTQATLQFIKRGDDATASGDLLVAQSNYGTAADRLQYAEPDKAQSLRVLSTVAAGRALGVDHPVQGAGGVEQPTAEFKDRVRLFQKENGISESGELDGRTRESIGRMQLRGREVVVPPAAAVAAAPALVLTPQAVTPPIEVRMNATQMLAIPASPKTAAMIHANRRH